MQQEMQSELRRRVKDIRKLFASRVVAIDEEAHKRNQSLENKCASLEKEIAGWRKKEAKCRKKLELCIAASGLLLLLAVDLPKIFSRIAFHMSYQTQIGPRLLEVSLGSELRLFLVMNCVVFRQTLHRKKTCAYTGRCSRSIGGGSLL